ncbi:MAG: hypothetical protein WC606_02680 [Candidatus Absconditabacterales bacterium]
MKVLEPYNKEKDKKKKQSKGGILAQITITALLAILPMSAKTTAFQADAALQENAYDSAKESVELNNETLFKNAVKQALAPINSLKNIPAGGIPLKYPPSYTGDLPKTIDFFPKEMKAEKLPFSLIRIGTKMFLIVPDLGFEIDEMYMDEKAFYIRVVGNILFGGIKIHKEISKSKEEELPSYLEKLRSQGKNGKYAFSTVYEIPGIYQKTYIKDLEKCNTRLFPK